MEDSRTRRRQAREARARKNRARLRILLGIVALAAVAFAAWKIIPGLIPEPEPELPPEPEYTVVPDMEAERWVDISVRCAGDVMAHTGQTDSARRDKGAYYNWEEHFKYVAPYMMDADLTMANLETTLKGAPPYLGYPSFNAPDSLGWKLKNMGVDVAIFANNHMFDLGLKTTERTVDALRSMGMQVVGAQHAGEKRYQIVDVKGIKIGVVAYTYETPRNGGRRTINAGVLSDDAYSVINSFTQDSQELLDKDLAVIAQQMQAARDDGAQVVILYMHWGEEYQKDPNRWQKYMAQKMANAGADVIFASHPHVIQAIEELKVNLPDGSAKNVPVFYSMGNFISNQRTESLSGDFGTAIAAKTEQGMIACVGLRVCVNDGRHEITEVSFIPTWVDRYSKGSTYEYGIIPLTKGFESNPMLLTSGHVSRAQAALKSMTDLIGEKYVNTEAFDGNTARFPKDHR
ncbi:MAG: CapA family protein [Firmicutes bacterium]|nr:CapA family protein [Bacillota bacterium]